MLPEPTTPFQVKGHGIGTLPRHGCKTLGGGMSTGADDGGSATATADCDTAGAAVDAIDAAPPDR